MSRRKRVAIDLLLLAFALWPLAQIGLSLGYEVNPWKLGGWGMYAAPQIPAHVRVWCLDGGDVGVCPFETLPPDLDPALQEFLRLRLALGRLARPDGLAAALLAGYPELREVRIEVLQPFLDRATARIEERSTTYEYP